MKKLLIALLFSGLIFAQAPVKIVDGNYNEITSGIGPPAITDRGLYVRIIGANASGSISLGVVGNGADGVSNAVGLFTPDQNGSSAFLQFWPYTFNGTTWDRQFSCRNSATISVTAGATTQIVALASAKKVRVCSFVITESLAGTAKFLYGTGTNCVTGPVDLTAAMALPTNGNISARAPSGSNLFETASANALCLASVTGTITGFLTYAQY
jgi:hypothetical protein